MLFCSLFFKKMLLNKIPYKIYNDKLLAIVKNFKTWKYYLKGNIYKILVFINYKKFYHFINTKNLSFF